MQAWEEYMQQTDFNNRLATAKREWAAKSAARELKWRQLERLGYDGV